MGKYRFIGDPAERDAGIRIEPGPWLDLPIDPERARKIMGNPHYEIEGAVVLRPKRAPRVKAEKRPIQHEGYEDSDGQSV